MDKIFIVDGNWYLHRVWFTLRTKRPIEEALPYALVGLIMKDACAVRATHLLVAFDGPSVFRYKIYPEYKATRKGKQGGKDQEEGATDIYSYLPAVRAGLEAAGICWIQPKTYEADDVLASAAGQYSGRVILGSRDKDGYQSLNDHTVAYDSTPDAPVFITREAIEKKFGFSVSQMVMYQTLIGDAIDNIPSLRPPAKAKKIIQTWGSFAAWFKGSKEDRAWIRANEVALRLNKKLVSMATDLALPELQSLRVPKLKRENMPKPWYAYQDLCYPKSRGLFKK
jgi:DNA polymerase-1